MQLKKRWMALGLSFVLVAGMLSGCGTTDAEETEDTSEATEAEFDYSEGLTDEGFFDGITALDYLTLPEYLGIEIPVDTYTVSDEDLQEEIDSYLELYAETEQLTEGTVEDGDTLNIDYVGTIDGEEFDGGSTDGAGTTVTIGVTSYIDDFLEQLIGHSVGETFDIEVTFPDDYDVEDYQGLDAVFTITINYIEGDEIIPDFTDDFVSENLYSSYGWSTMDEMTADLTAELQESAVLSYIWTYLDENTVFSDIPESLITYQQNSAISYYDYYASLYGLDLDTFIYYFFGLESQEDLLVELEETIEASAKESLIIQAIAEDAGITISDDDVADYFETYLGVTDYEDYVTNYGIGYIKMSVLYTYVQVYIMDNVIYAE